MRITSISLGLIAIACAAGQAADPLGPSSRQENYAWAPEGGSDDVALQAESLSAAVSDLQFRAQFLSNFEEYSKSDNKFQAEDAACGGAKLIVEEALTGAKGILATLGGIPGVGLALVPAIVAIQGAIVTVNTVLDGGNLLALGAANTAFGTAETALTGISYPLFFLSPILSPVIALLERIRSSINTLVTCATGGSRVEMGPTYCNDLADMYRIVASESAKTSSAVVLPADASEDLKRLVAGSISVLNLMDKSSIVSTNDALLASRPVFAADLLDQYRTELLRVATTDDIKNYAQVGLGFAMGISNALEACLHIAADPIAAAEELKEELAFGEEEEKDDEEDEE